MFFLPLPIATPGLDSNQEPMGIKELQNRALHTWNVQTQKIRYQSGLIKTDVLK